MFNIKNFNPDKSLYIEASAGTGKTFTIKKIVQKLVVENKTPLEKILIVTYTEKAAGELKDRIRDILSDQKDVNVDNASIFTIHSFCQKILGEYAYTAGLPLALELIDDSGVNDFIDRWVRDELTEDTEFKKLIENCEKPDKLVDGLKDDFTEALKHYYLNKDFSENSDIVAEDPVFYTESYDKAKKMFDSGSLQGNKQLFSTKPVREEFPTAYFYYKKLPLLYKAWQKEKEQLKVQTFDDMIRSVREAVYQGSPLQKVLQEIFKYAIIDEFQDTNQKQWDIFSTVFLNCPEHSIFVVGDPKQSIYAFQGADVNVYTQAKTQIGNGETLDMNFRSTDNLVKACNTIFSGNQAAADSFFAGNTDISFAPSNPCGKIQNPVFNNQASKVIWLAPEDQNEWDFAELAVQKIVECCQKDKNGHTKLQVFDKDIDKDGAMRDVTFKDFAILARTRTEMIPIEAKMTYYGIPFSRYKDTKLFEGKECSMWISLFSAIDSEDFSGSKRKILNEALFTDFFGIKLNELEASCFDNPGCIQRQMILGWKHLAQNQEWANLMEAIFKDTEVESRLSSLDKIQSLGKLRQIANYSADYLLKQNCTINELIKHLKKLSENSANDDENIIARSTDFDCVQVMTIHASKGLDFPVVIGAGGFKSYNDKISQAYIFHDNNHQLKLGFTKDKDKKVTYLPDTCKSLQKKEQILEWQRLYYVAYTRASSLMILPRYDCWNKPRTNYKFLKNGIQKLCDDAAAKSQFVEEIDLTPNFNTKAEVQAILGASGTNQTLDDGEQNQLKELKKLKALRNSINTKMNSYCSLSHTVPESENGITDLTGFDENSIQIGGEYNPEIIQQMISSTYPKGTNLGTTVHEVFEFADFTACDDEKRLNNLILKCFKGNGYSISENDDKKWCAQTLSFVQNTLRAKLPEIKGGASTGNYFTLSQISPENHRSEVEFDLNPELKALMTNYYLGFIDLMFVREVNGQKIYSIADWKTDTLSSEELENPYGDNEFLSKHVASHYSIQRVLYSYCLIKWLKQFYGSKTQNDEQKIFEEHFGGIYYVIIRGCHEGTSNGIYAQTWKSWAELEGAFKNICEKLLK